MRVLARLVTRIKRGGKDKPKKKYNYTFNIIFINNQRSHENKIVFSPAKLEN